jgi:hypothetical protein
MEFYSVFDPQSEVPSQMALMTSGIGGLCLLWSIYSMHQFYGRSVSLKSPMVVQWLGWSIFIIEMGILTYANATYLKCERPFVQLVPSVAVGKCYYTVLHRVGKILNTLGSSCLMISVILRFQPAYAAFNPTLVNRIHRVVYAFLGLYTLLTVVMFGIGAKYRDSVTMDPKNSNSPLEMVERHISLIWSIILLSVNCISAVQGMRFVLNKIRKCRAALSPSGVFGSIETHPRGYLSLTYFFLLLNASMAILYLACKLNWIPFYQGYPYITRTTVNNTIVKFTLMCMMLALNSLGKAVTKGYETFERSRNSPVSTKFPKGTLSSCPPTPRNGKSILPSFSKPPSNLQFPQVPVMSKSRSTLHAHSLGSR